MSDLKIVVAGASGRMGRTLIREIAQGHGLMLCGALEAAGHSSLGMDSGTLAGMQANGIRITADPLSLLAAGAQAVIDFTTPGASADLARFCADHGGPALVMGSTGFDAAELATIADAAKTIAIVRSGSFSLGLNMLVGLVEQAARALDRDDWDVEIVEAHHRHKIDAPSGTALMLGQAAAGGRGIELDTVARRARDGLTGARPAGEIGFAVLRGGSIVGEHGVSFCAEGETVTLSHSAGDRIMFARGAIAAALWVAACVPGEYDMRDVLGLNA